MAGQGVLVVNAGSSSVKAAIFGPGEAALAAGMVSEIGGAARLHLDGREAAVVAPDHDAALALLLEGFAAAGHPVSSLGAAGHRVVHGGGVQSRPVRIDAGVIDAIAAAAPLAPLHNPHNLAAIRALGRLVPDLPQVACFDTGFHVTNAEVASTYALPAAERARGIRRYGFHGLSYAALVRHLPAALGQALPERLLALHLGNGASLCAIRGGRSVATTMGYSPLDGLTMGTRAGAIDGNAVLRLAEEHGIAGASRILNRESGLLGLGGASDMRALRAAATPEADFAIAHFTYWARRHAGSMIAAMEGLDAIAFTGGIGENDAAVRSAICDGLGWLGVRLDARANAAGRARIDAAGSAVAVAVVAAAEEAYIAAATRACLGDGGAGG